jgi:hypothetical protein
MWEKEGRHGAASQEADASLPPDAINRPTRPVFVRLADTPLLLPRSVFILSTPGPCWSFHGCDAAGLGFENYQSWTPVL